MLTLAEIFRILELYQAASKSDTFYAVACINMPSMQIRMG